MQLPAIAQVNKHSSKDTIFRKFANTALSGYVKTNPYYICVWENEIPSSIKIIRRLDDKVAIIELINPTAFDALNLHARISPANDNWKFSPAAEKRIQNNKSNIQKFIVSGQQIDSLLSILQRDPIALEFIFINRASQSVIIKCKVADVTGYLLHLKEVIFIDVTSAAHVETNIIGYDRSFHGLNQVDYLIPGANGKDIVAGVKEQNMEPADLDLYKRVLPSSIGAATISNHATVIASIIGGAGNSFYDGRGIANGCMFFPSSFANLFADDAAVLDANKVTVQNHSYGTIIQQFYGAEAVSYDAYTWHNKNFVPVFSAGNKGLESASEGPYTNLNGYANLTGNFKMAKNVITVGAIDNKGNVAPESSAGPVYDGRIAPHLMALGPNGTSDAAAIVSGTIAVMQQVYADSNNRQLPSSSLIKAALYNSAEDIYNKGIDYKTGYGLLDSYGSIKTIQQKKFDGGYLAQNNNWLKIINVPQGAARLKVTLAWTDTTASVNNNKAISNDLDVEVKALGTGIVYKPWVLNNSTNIDSLKKLPVRNRDSLNTAEQVSIDLPAADTYEIKVIGNNVVNPPLSFHIAYGVDTLNTFTFLNPLHASDVNRQENQTLHIKWRTFVADTNQTGNLSISYDKGNNWQLLKQSIKIYSNQYQWQIPDSNTAAILKMETAFGIFLSKEFIISTVIRPTVDFICADSFRLSWTRHVYANSYKIFTLTGSPYLQPILNVTDTFVVLKRSSYPSLVYAVEPILNNGLAAARSIAMNIELQGVNCFYKTLNYNLLDYNQLNMQLELSVATYADSVFFEGVSATGQLLQTYGSAKVTNNNLIYDQLVNEVPTAGFTYLRGRIKLKNGAVVYTDIIPVLTSGKKSILFYPNPVPKGVPLRHVLQQGLFTSSKLQFFDAYGRLLKSYSSLPDNIDVSQFPTGVIFYKLLNEANITLEGGKIVIL